ncbi:MAG: hypothetical protein K0R87_1753, partial [Pseudonocardia sp.]|nr:hypothetical protein [Pseudonocardia sp.]
RLADELDRVGTERERLQSRVTDLEARVGEEERT